MRFFLKIHINFVEGFMGDLKTFLGLAMPYQSCLDEILSWFLVIFCSKESQTSMIPIKTHGSVSCSPRNQENLGVQQTSVYFTGVKKMPFSRICSSALPEQKHTKFSV